MFASDGPRQDRSRETHTASASIAAVTILAVSLASVVPAVAARASSTLLPSTLIGEALAVALAFSLPALLAGAYLMVRAFTKRIGVRSAVVLGALGIGLGFGWAVIEVNPGVLEGLPRLARSG